MIIHRRNTFNLKIFRNQKCVSTSVSAGIYIRSDEFKVTTGNCIQFSTIQTFGPEISSLGFEPSWQLRT